MTTFLSRVMPKFYFNHSKFFRSSVACSVLCFKSNDCTAFSYQKETQSCQLGLKGKSVPSVPTNDISTSIYTKPGLMKHSSDHKPNNHLLLFEIKPSSSQILICDRSQHFTSQKDRLVEKLPGSYLCSNC